MSFYQTTQVMIGEAIAISELKDMLKEHSSELSAVGPAVATRAKASKAIPSHAK
jgi:hypothetical protein